LSSSKDDKVFAIEMAMALIQNNNIKPVFGQSKSNDIGDENSIAYIIGDTRYTLSSIVSHFLDNIERIKKWD
jgi:hypothetical protein